MSEQRAAYRINYADRRAASRATAREAKQLASTEPGQYSAPEPELIRALIEQQGWTQIEVADTLRVNVSTVRRWCADRAQRQFAEIPYTAWWMLLYRAGVMPAGANE